MSLFYLVAYLAPFSIGLLISPTGTFHLLGSRADHLDSAWRVFGGLLFVLAVVVSILIWKHRATGYVNTVIARLAFVALFSYLVGHTGNRAYVIVLAVLGLGELWSLIALAIDLRGLLGAR